MSHNRVALNAWQDYPGQGHKLMTRCDIVCDKADDVSHSHSCFPRPEAMRSLCAEPVVCRASAAQPARLRTAAPLHAALPAHRRRRSAALHVAARPLTVAVAVRAACSCACAPGAPLTSRASRFVRPTGAAAAAVPRGPRL